MGIASSMKELVEGIVSSHEDRTKTVIEIKRDAKRITEDTRALLKDFRTSRSGASAELRKDLARDKINRKSDVKRTLVDAAELIKGFHASREKQTTQLRKGLAKEAVERRAEVNTIRGDARKTMRTLGSRRKEASGNLREELAQTRSSRESEVEELLKDARDLVKEFAESREEAEKTLRKDLARGRTARESEVKAIRTGVDEMRTGFRQSQARVKVDINAARDVWQELTHSTLAKQSAIKTNTAEGENPDMEAKLLAAIAKHPHGITLTEVADGLSVVPIVLGRVSRRLVDEGKIRKQDKTYFPVAGE